MKNRKNILIIGISTILVLSFIIVLILVLIALNIKIVPQAHSFIVERLGAYKETWDVGLHIKVPFIDIYQNVSSCKASFCIKYTELFCICL